MMAHSNLQKYYTETIAMRRLPEGWNIHEIESLLCFEKLIYVDVISGRPSKSDEDEHMEMMQRIKQDMGALS